MLNRAANRIKRVVEPVSRIASYIGALALVVMVILTIAEVISRRAFNSPISGSLELTTMGLVVFVFMTLAYCAMKNGHVVLDILVVRLPKRIEATINTLILFLTSGILGVASWQLWLQGIRLQRAGQVSGLLDIPVYPFLYIAALGGILVTISYLLNFLFSFEEFRK